MTVPYEKIKEAAKGYEQDMTRFLRDIVKFPGESCGEKEHIDRIAEEMRKLDFDKVEIDPMGNVLGYMCGRDIASVIAGGPPGPLLRV